MSTTFNARSRTLPTLWVDLKGLRVPVTVPSLDKYEDFMARAYDVAKLENGLTEEGLKETFELFAEVISCNRNYMKFTAEDLLARDITVDYILDVLVDYIKFLYAVADLKN